MFLNICFLLRVFLHVLCFIDIFLNQFKNVFNLKIINVAYLNVTLVSMKSMQIITDTKKDPL